jgi:hypothetical protein
VYLAKTSSINLSFSKTKEDLFLASIAKETLLGFVISGRDIL